MRMGPRLSRITFANYASLGAKMDLSALAAKMAELLDPSLSWRDVDRLRALWKGPFLLKGILHPKEAAEAVARGEEGPEDRLSLRSGLPSQRSQFEARTAAGER